MNQKQHRQNRIRQQIKPKDLRYRLSVYRSNKHLYAQVIDDTKKMTVAASSDISIKKENKDAGSKAIGIDVAKKAIKAGASNIYFDRGSSLYHGKIKEIADGAREGGLKF